MKTKLHPLIQSLKAAAPEVSRLPLQESTTIDEVRAAVSFDADTGQWARLVRTAPNAIPGPFVPCQNGDGYHTFMINGRTHSAHRIAWLLCYGKWPEGQIDHINGDKSDNRIANLRDVPQRTNGENRRTPLANNKVGFLGVSVNKSNPGRYLAQIQIAGKNVHIGYFKTPEEAHEAYIETKRRRHAGCTI